MKEKLSTLMAEYGKVALGVWFTIFGLSIATFAAMIAFGFEVDGAAGSGGTLLGAYLATQLIKPLRIGATLVLTPIIGTWLGHSRKERPAPEPALDEAE